MAAEQGWKEGGSCSFPRTRHPNEQEDQESKLLIRVTILQEQTLLFISSVRGVGQTPTDGGHSLQQQAAYANLKTETQSV